MLFLASVVDDDVAIDSEVSSALYSSVGSVYAQAVLFSASSLHIKGFLMLTAFERTSSV